MGRKPTAVKIKKNRFDIILKDRDISIQKLADATGHSRTGVSKALTNRKMDPQALDHICQWLDVSPLFFTGEDKLIRVKQDRLEEFKESYKRVPITSSGYVIPTYRAYLVQKDVVNYDLSNVSLTDIAPEFGLIQQVYLIIGKEGIYDEDRHVNITFDKQFIDLNYNYLVYEALSFMLEQASSALSQDEKYKEYCRGEELTAQRIKEDEERYQSFFEEVQEDSDE